jgi:hypothetical protein
MNENMKTTIMQKLENMTDEAGRQLLDYIEFLESKFNRSTRERSTFERLAENVEGTLRSSKIGEAAVKGTGGIIDVAGTVARSFAAAGQAVLDELQDVIVDDVEKSDEGKGGEPATETDEGGSSDIDAEDSAGADGDGDDDPDVKGEHKKSSA